MNSVLWSQGIFATDPGYFVIDNVFSRYSGTPEQDAALSLMNNGKFSTLKKHCDVDMTSPSFVMKKNKEWFCIEGNFNEKDSADRLRVFRFITNFTEKDKIIQTLSEYADKMGCTVNNNDIEQIKKRFPNSFFRKMLLLCAAIIIMAIVTTICVIIKYK